MQTPPTVNISVSPTTITVGQSATLAWSSTMAVSCSASGTGWSGNQQVMGSMSVTPTTAGTVTYILTCAGASSGGGAYGGGGGGALTAMQTASLTVNPPPATAYVVKELVADGAAVAVTQDTHLVNGWGLTFAPNDVVWTSNNASSTSSLYDGNGAIFQMLPFISLPTAFQPTGIAWYAPPPAAAAGAPPPPPADFMVTENGATTPVSGPALFIYSSLGGQIAGWAPDVDPKNAVVAYSAKDGACYRGLALANNGTANFLYANDFVGAKIDVLDRTFTKQSTAAFPFIDPNLPKYYAPFGIQAIQNGPPDSNKNPTWQIYVSYAMSGSGCEDTRGPGYGMISVFDANGKLVTGELVPVGGSLNAPWGLALAPKDFGTLSGALLVSNHADGKINGYDPVSGAFIGTLETASGAFAQDGLWGIAFGNDVQNQPHNTLFFTAGPNGGTNGLYGRIDLPSM
jgi:uncharacterized protein (TIGR03118 family)